MNKITIMIIIKRLKAMVSYELKSKENNVTNFNGNLVCILVFEHVAEKLSVTLAKCSMFTFAVVKSIYRTVPKIFILTKLFQKSLYFNKLFRYPPNPKISTNFY